MIKQTQTKMFDFADVGLDFCVGSKNLIQDRFKKMLSAGFNPQTANSVTISGSQITFTYGVNHGYVADRVLLVTASGGFNKEVYVDSVTASTVTCTVLDGITTGLTGTLNTKVAPLGYELVYEVGNIQIYKFKALDETDLFLRLCFENVSTRRSNISPCIGKTYNASTGFIDDPYTTLATSNITSPAVFSWDFTDGFSSTYDNYTYSQGYSTFGKAQVVGSKYHFLVLSWQSLSTWRASINGFLPQTSKNPRLNYPVILGWRSNNGASSRSGYGQASQYTISDATGYGDAYVGNYRVTLSNATLSATNTKLVDPNIANSSFYPSEIEDFNTTSAKPLSLHLINSKQFVGYVSGGAYLCCYASTNTPPNTYQTSPAVTTDIDLSNIVLTHLMSDGSNATSAYFAVPVEEIKIGA